MEKEAKFVSSEFLENFRESLKQMSSFSQEMCSYIETGITAPYLTKFAKNCNLLLTAITEWCEANLDFIENIDVLKEEELKKAFNSYCHMESYSETLRALEKAVYQRFPLKNAYHVFFHSVPLELYYPRICAAADKITQILTKIFFENCTFFEMGGEGQIAKEAKIIPMVMFGDSPYYQISTSTLEEKKQKIILFRADIPRCDVYRYRLWPLLAHEIAHVKLNKTVKAELRSPSELYISYPSEGQKLYEKLEGALTLEILNAYKNSDIFSNSYKNKPYQFYSPVAFHIDELLADIASASIFGLPSLFSLICIAGDPSFDLITRNALPTDHPPLSIRINTIKNYLKTLGGQSSYFTEALSDVEYDISSLEKTIYHFSAFEDLINSYNSAIESNFGEIIKFVNDYLISKPEINHPHLWTHYVSLYLNDQTNLNDACSKPIECFIRAWAKRWAVYKRLNDGGHNSFKQFISYHKHETKILGQLINDLNRM